MYLTRYTPTGYDGNFKIITLLIGPYLSSEHNLTEGSDGSFDIFAVLVLYHSHRP